MIALTTWLRILKVPSVAFCWTVWAIVGKASGAYVGPTCWAVLFLAAAAAILHQRVEVIEDMPTYDRLSAFRSSLARGRRRAAEGVLNY